MTSSKQTHRVIKDNFAKVRLTDMVNKKLLIVSMLKEKMI